MSNLFDSAYGKDSDLYYPQPTAVLVEYVTSTGLKIGPALDAGCGDGRNSLWLAKQGFDVTAIDSSPVAIAKVIHQANMMDVGSRIVTR